ncbi:hypothetical protein F5I97DRAFT_1800278 [Phlebopus sp. FC_14]|nr:hypothetical protein F5I97DRAFT_1800278 [Phlebopus sp. FC_14]
MTATRSKQSATPLPAVVRSVKRLRSGLSSNRAVADEPATRVLALWKQDGHYYCGTVHTHGSKGKYVVKFDDGTEDEVELKNMRVCQFVLGDNVILVQDDVRAKVSDVGELESRAVIQVEVDDGADITISEVELRDIRVAARALQSQWKNRTLGAGAIVTHIRPKLALDTTPSRLSLASSLCGKGQRQLAKTGFVVTLSPKNNKPDQAKENAVSAIRQHGGLVIDDWSSVFTMEGKHSQANKRWIATPEDFRWKSETNLDRVFLLSDDAHQKPKFLLALALGIPCLSFEWLTKASKFSSVRPRIPICDWQPFLLSAGYSDALGARISQLVDLDWGNCIEYLTDIMFNRVASKPFAQKSFLCVGPDLVPLPPQRNRKNVGEVERSREASRVVPWIILCMGASKVEAVTDIKLIPASQMKAFNYIIVKDRGDVGGVTASGAEVTHVNWVKECLISSRVLPREWN